MTWSRDHACCGEGHKWRLLLYHLQKCQQANLVSRRFWHGQTWTLPRVVRTPRETCLHQTLRRELGKSERLGHRLSKSVFAWSVIQYPLYPPRVAADLCSNQEWPLNSHLHCLVGSPSRLRRNQCNVRRVSPQSKSCMFCWQGRWWFSL